MAIRGTCAIDAIPLAVLAWVRQDVTFLACNPGGASRHEGRNGEKWARNEEGKEKKGSLPCALGKCCPPYPGAPKHSSSGRQNSSPPSAISHHIYLHSA